MRALIVIGLVVALAGCETAQSTQPQMSWMRLDGQRSTGNPKLEQEFYAARYNCQSQATGVANAGPPPAPQVTVNQTMQIGGGYSPPPLRQFDSSSTIAAAEAGRRQADSDALFESCMNAAGYRLGVPPA